MRILTSVKLSPHKYKTPEGYLVCQDAILARTGKQDYYKSEIYENFDGEDEVVSVDRNPEQVFAAETLASFENKPITVEHPNESVGPDNWDQLAVGNVRNVRKGTYNGQDVMIADLIINRADAIEDIENGIRTELSCGYDCDITEGPNPQQINIRGNHLALCEQGRAGIAKIIDSKPIEDGKYWNQKLSNKKKALKNKLIEELNNPNSKYKDMFDNADLIVDLVEFDDYDNTYIIDDEVFNYAFKKLWKKELSYFDAYTDDKKLDVINNYFNPTIDEIYEALKNNYGYGIDWYIDDDDNWAWIDDSKVINDGKVNHINEIDLSKVTTAFNKPNLLFARGKDNYKDNVYFSIDNGNYWRKAEKAIPYPSSKYDINTIPVKHRADIDRVWYRARITLPDNTKKYIGQISEGTLDARLINNINDPTDLRTGDHIDRNVKNNSSKNVRLATNAEQVHNRGLQLQSLLPSETKQINDLLYKLGIDTGDRAAVNNFLKSNGAEHVREHLANHNRTIEYANNRNNSYYSDDEIKKIVLKVAKEKGLVVDSKSIKDVQPRKNESKDDFISRFMEETKEEYPDENQRVAIAYSYWNRAKGIKDSENDFIQKFNDLYNDVFKYFKNDDYIIVSKNNEMEDIAIFDRKGTLNDNELKELFDKLCKKYNLNFAYSSLDYNDFRDVYGSEKVKKVYHFDIYEPEVEDEELIFEDYETTSKEYRGFIIYNVSNYSQPAKYHVSSLYKTVPDISNWEFKTIDEAKEAIDKYLATTITDSTAMLPIDTKDKLRKYFGSVSKHMSNDVKIEDIITPITEMGLNPIREKIDGWKEIADGFYRKNYFFTIDGFNDLFMISLYADSRDNWKVNEVNAYFIGKKQDLNYDAMPEIRTSNEIRGWLLDVIEEADNKSQSVREYFDSKIWLNNMMTRIVNENLVIGRWNESANTAEKLDTIILDPGMSLEELENQLKQSTLITDNKLVMNSNKDSKNKYVIYKENGKFKGTAYDNYSADIINANKVQDYSDFENLEQLVEYLLDNTNVKRENIITIGDSLSKSLLKKQIKSLEKQYDNLEKEDEKIKDENKELYTKQKGNLKKELKRQIEKKKAELVEDSKDPCDLNIKEWYMSEYPNDSLGEEINDNITFNDLFETLDRRQSVYNLLGNSIDSLIREACFEKLAELIGESYDYVYNQWLLCDEG